MPVLAAMANAVHHAAGARMTQLPMNPVAVMAAIQDEAGVRKVACSLIHPRKAGLVLWVTPRAPGAMFPGPDPVGISSLPRRNHGEGCLRLCRLLLGSPRFAVIMVLDNNSEV